MRDDGRDGTDADDRPPICPACGVTMGMVLDEDDDDRPRHVCLECGFDEQSATV